MKFKIKEIRQARGITQKEVSQGTGINRPEISVIENNKKDVLVSTLKKIAVFFGVKIDDLIE